MAAAKATKAALRDRTRGQVSGPGLHSATANHATHVIVELSDCSGRPCSRQQKVTGKLVPAPAVGDSRRWPWAPISDAVATSARDSRSKKPSVINVTVAAVSPSRYEVSYTAVSRGLHKLYLRVNDRETNGSPFTVTVYPDPTQLGHPLRAVTDLNFPYGIAFNSRGDMAVTECWGQNVSVYDIRGQRIRTFGSAARQNMVSPTGIAIDDADNIYVSSDHKLQKFAVYGEPIKCVGKRGSKEGEFRYPRGLALYKDEVFVCDSDNHRIQVFDMDLNFVRSFGSQGKGQGEFLEPRDITFDAAGNMYVADCWNERIQVLDQGGGFIRAFGKAGQGGPASVLVADVHVYVCDISQHRIVVYTTTGQLVTSFGRWGKKEGDFATPLCVTSCSGGYIHVADFSNNRVQIF